jgi:hypothetical protein
MKLPPEIIEAMHREYEAMGLGFNEEALAQFGFDMPELVDLAISMGSPQEIARALVEKIVAAHIEHELPKCVREFGDATLISMPLLGTWRW